MLASRRTNPRPGALLAVLALALAGCATSPPPVDVAGARFDLPPYRAANEAPPAGEVVVWGGMVVAVENRREHTEIEVLAYPLNKRLQPSLKGPTEGRFFAILPGYVESFDYPQGRFVTLRGTLAGTREGRIDERAYVYPLLDVEKVHLWPQGFQYDTGPNISIGVGFGVVR